MEVPHAREFGNDMVGYGLVANMKRKIMKSVPDALHHYAQQRFDRLERHAQRANIKSLSFGVGDMEPVAGYLEVSFRNVVTGKRDAVTMRFDSPPEEITQNKDAFTGRVLCIRCELRDQQDDSVLFFVFPA